MDKSLKVKIAELRSQIGVIAKNKENPFYNSAYFDINQLLENLQPHLMELNLDVIQPLKDGKVVTIIRDLDSDETEKSELSLPNIDDPQKMGSAITYYRRYTLKSLLAIQEEDDDGNRASKTSKSNSGDDEKPWLNKTEYKSDELTDDWKKVVARLKKHPEHLEKVYSHYKVNKENRQELEQIVEQAKDEPTGDNKDNEDLPF